MMDEMKLKLSTKFMRGIVSKLISRMIYKNTGCKVDIQLNDLDILMFNGDTTVKMNVEARLKSDEFTKVMKSIGLD